MFNNCCSEPKEVHYSMFHQPIPLVMVPELRNTIDNLLWYIPGIASYQSQDNYLIDDDLYSLPIYEDVLSAIGMSERDVLRCDGSKIDSSIVSFFEKKVCVNCQKIILTKYKSETWLRALLRHTRNAIAHGLFTVVGDLVVFWDERNEKENKVKTAFLKIDAVKFYNALKVIEDFGGATRKRTSGVIEQRIISRVFEKNGYTVKQEYSIGNLRVDFIAEKDDKKYAVEIKIYSRAIGAHTINRVESQLDVYLGEGYTPILIFDKGYLHHTVVDKFTKKNFIVLDKENLNKFFKGELEI